MTWEYQEFATTLFFLFILPRLINSWLQLLEWLTARWQLLISCSREPVERYKLAKQENYQSHIS